jgi:hypothetical protein
LHNEKAIGESANADEEHNEEVLHIVDDFDDHSDQSGSSVKCSQEVEEFDPQQNGTEGCKEPSHSVQVFDLSKHSILSRRDQVQYDNHHTEQVVEQVSEVPS